MHTRRPAFTLIELMVVMVIISLLTAAAVISFNKAQTLARDNQRKTTLGTVATALETYYRENHSFPGEKTGTASGCQYSDGANLYYTYVPGKNCAGYFPFSLSEPAVAWIPGIYPYVTTYPIDKRFVDMNGVTYDQVVSGGATAAVNDPWLSSQRSFAYRKLDNGYVLYARLEASDYQEDTAAGLTQTRLTDPVYPTALTGNDPKAATSEHPSVYFIRN